MNFDPSKNSESKIYPNEKNSFRVGTGAGDFLKLFQDPTTLGFKLFFENISSEGSIGTGLLGGEANSNSALYYLDKMGDTARFEMLKDFKKLLSKLNSEYPWYFQSIDGLSDAWARDFSKPKFKKEVTISCLESIDLRITALMDLYRKVAYDWQNRRCILPDNLRKFQLSIKVYDIRNFKRDPGQFLESNEINENKKEFNEQFLGNTIEDTTQVTFNLSHCEFMSNDSGSVFGSVSNASYESAVQTIKISYENINEDNIYRSLVALGNQSNHYYVRDYLKKELDLLKGSFDQDKLNAAQKRAINDVPGVNNPNFSGYEATESRAGESNVPMNMGNQFGAKDDDSEIGKPKLPNFVGNQFGKIPKNAEERKALLKAAGERAKQEVGDLVDDIKSNVSAAAANLIKSKLSSLFLGNVYGFSASSTLGTARNKIVNAPGKKLKDLGNSFGKGKN